LGINFVFAIGAYIVAAYLEKDYPLIAFRVFSIVLVVCSAVWILVGITQLLTGIFRLRRRTRNPQIKEKTA
jgi:ABC-type branched-subunit amino acid transport system permease subunit